MYGVRQGYQPFIVCQAVCPYSTASHASSSREQTLYEVLDISETATLGEIRDAFITKSKESHPDMDPLKPELHDTFVQINEAYNILSNASRRREYDLTLQNTFNSSASGTNPFGSVPRNRQSSYSYYYDRATSSSNYRQSRDYGFTAPVVNSAQKQKHNKMIMIGAFVFMVAGAAASYFIIRSRHKLYRAQAEESNRKAGQLYAQAVERGRENGLKRQLEHLIAQHSSGLEKIAATKSLQHFEEKRK